MQTVDGAIARYQTGDQTLIDTLLAEEDLTQDRLALVRSGSNTCRTWCGCASRPVPWSLVHGHHVTPDQLRFDPSEFVVR
jgi:hypothetical protein